MMLIDRDSDLLELRNGITADLTGKVQLFEPIDATAGTTTTLTVDFDVDRNFVILGNPDTPAGIMGILFTPVLMEKDRVEG